MALILMVFMMMFLILMILIRSNVKTSLLYNEILIRPHCYITRFYKSS